MTCREKLKKIFEKHGVSKQLKKLSEEVFELQEAIMTFQHSRVFTDVYIQDITEEFADVMVVLSQIKEIYGLDEDEIRDIMKLKIDRQCERDGIKINENN